MGGLFETRFTWDLKIFSTLQEKGCYSRPFSFAGWNWHIIAYPKSKGYGSCKHLSVYLGLMDLEYLPSGWKKEVKFRLSVVNKISKYDTKVFEGKQWFSASNHSWGFNEFLPLFKLRYRDYGFLVGDKITIVADLHVFPAIFAPKETVKTIEEATQDGLDGDDDDGESEEYSEDDDDEEDAGDDDDDDEEDAGDDDEEDAGDDNDDEEDAGDDDDGEEDAGDDDDDEEDAGDDDEEDAGDDNDDEEDAGDDDDGEEDAGDDDDDEEDAGDDDDSSPVYDDGGREKIPLKDGSLTLRKHDTSCNDVVSETEVTKVDNDNAPKEDPEYDDSCEYNQGDDDDASSLVSNESDKDHVSPVEELKSMEDAFQTVGNGDTGCTKVASVITEASNDLLNEIQQKKEIMMDVNGFQVLASQVESVSHIFKRHPDIALASRPKSQQMRRAYMNELLSLIEMLCQSPEKLSEDDISNAEEILVDLIDAGFKLDWLKTKLSEVSEKKKMVQGSCARIQTMEEQLQKLKLMFLDLETQLLKEKAEALAARAPLSFNDVVC